MFSKDWDSYLPGRQELIDEITKEYEEAKKRIEEMPVTSEKEMNSLQPEILPLNNNLEELTKGKTPVLRTWENGKYSCPTLPAFINAYIKIADDLTHTMIRDYLIYEKSKKPFTDKTIEQQMKLYGPGRRPKT
jgi:hypothetical protein